MRRGAPTFLLAAVMLAGWSARAQQPSPGSDLAELYSRGMAEFQSGAYSQAASDLEALTHKAELSAQLEPVFYTIGTAHFNAADYKKAVLAFENYLKNFAQGPHASEASFGLAQSNLLQKNYAAATAGFAQLERDSRFREQALLFEATAAKEANQIDSSIASLEKLTSGDLTTPTALRGAIMLAQLYAQKGKPERSLGLLRKLRQRAAAVENLAELNSTIVDLGDSLYRGRQFAEALECYRAAFSREEIVKRLGARASAMQRAIDGNLAIARSDPSQVTQIVAENNRIKADLARTQTTLTEFEKLPSITPAIYVRMARCFDETDRKWEAAVVYQQIIDRLPKVTEREPALFGLILEFADVNEAAKAQQRCEQYLREFKAGPNAETVGYLLGAMALEANNPKAAETYFGKALTNQPKSSFREQMRYLLANAKLAQGKYDEAGADYKKYLNDFPKGQFREDAQYRIALGELFAGKYESAMNTLRDYLTKNGHAAYVTDAKYRLAVCKYAASLYDDVIRDCREWEADYPKNQQLGEVLALHADALAGAGRDEEATPVYIHSFQTAATEDVINYSLFAASKLLQKKGDWERVSALFADFIEKKPDSPSIPTALYWIGKAKAHEGKLDEAKQITADTIKKYINDPHREAVELLLSQLAQLCLKRPAGDTGDARVELENLLASSADASTATARSRILYAKAELARLRRQPAEEERSLAEIARTFKPEELSPVLLGCAGDYLRAQNLPDQAAKFYQCLLDEFPKSDNVDFAYAGLGEMALTRNELPRALKLFSDGTDKIAANTRLRDLTLGKAKTLLAMQRYVEAKKVFEQVASVREWRGEATAFAVYSLGEIEARRFHWAEANAYYQRVYVSYQKFLPWVAKAYLHSAECLEKLGKPQEAANTYREMLRNDRLASFSETAEARRKLESMGQRG